MEGGSNVDGDESGGTSPSRQGAGTGILVPRNLVAMAAEIGIASGKRSCGIRVSSMGVKIGPKGGTRGGPSRPGALLARPEGGGARWLMSTHASILVDYVGPPSAEVCRTAAISLKWMT